MALTGQEKCCGRETCTVTMPNWMEDLDLRDTKDREILKRELTASLTASPTASILTDPYLPDNPIIEANTSFLKLTGYRREEIIGRNCRFLRGPGTSPEQTQALCEAIAGQYPVVVELQNYRSDGTPFQNAVLVAPVFDGGGVLAFFIGSQVELNTGLVTAGRLRRQAARMAVDALTERQAQVLKRVALGLRNKQIADELGITERTVKMHRNVVMRRLGVRSSADLVRIAVEAGF